MNRRFALPTLTMAVLAATGCVGCSPSPPREPNCAVPPNENRLLDDYAGDPALTFVPDGAERGHPIARQRGCLRMDKEDVSRTSTETSFTLTRDYDQDALLAAYGPVLTDHGWSPDEIRQAELGTGAGQPFLAYCRVVRGVTSELSVSANPATRYDVRPSGPNRPPSPQRQEAPGVIVLVIEAVPERPNCEDPAPS